MPRTTVREIVRATSARVAALGYHPSLLPLHRGRDAVRWTIRDRDKVTGGSVYHLTDHTDAGSIAAQEHLPIPPGASAEALWRDHLAALGIALILRVLADLTAGRRVEVSQDEARATWEPSFDSAPLFKPELPQLPGSAAVDTAFAALHTGDISRKLGEWPRWRRSRADRPLSTTISSVRGGTCALSTRLRLPVLG